MCDFWQIYLPLRSRFVMLRQMRSSEDEQEGAKPLQLRDMPAQELPREKLQRHGRHALSDEELIALFLRTGLQGCNVLELAAKMKRAAGSLAALGQLEAHEIASLCKGVGPAKAATLAAVFELGARAIRERVMESDFREPQTVYDYLAPDLRYEPQETAVALLLDVNYRLIRRVNVSKGTISRVLVHPRDVFREAIRHNAHAVILAHNHPSGDPKPSRADRQLTEEILAAGDIMKISLRDHIIIGCESSTRDLPYFSFRDEGLFLF